MKRCNRCIFANYSKVCKVNKVIASFLFLFATFFANINAYAMNDDYLDESEWLINNNASVIQLSKQCAGNTLNGLFEYVVDDSDGCIYMYFSITESTLSVDYSDVKINVCAKTSSEKFNFSIDENSMCNSDNESAKYFTVNQNFEYYYATDSGLYIAAIETNISEKINYSINLYVNGHIYFITDNIYVDPPIETTTSKTSKQKPNSNKSKSSTKSKTSKSTTTKATKFSGTPATTKSSKQSVNAAQADSADGAIIVTASTLNNSESQEENTVQTSTIQKRKLYLIIGTSVASIGLLFIITALIVRNKELETEIAKSNNLNKQNNNE
jgi:hypothetical protein